MGVKKETGQEERVEISQYEHFLKVWEMLVSGWKGETIVGEEKLEGKKEILREQFFIRQAIRALEKREYHVDLAWKKLIAVRSRNLRVRNLMKYAAILVIMLGMAWLVLYNEHRQVNFSQVAVLADPVKTELVLANGKSVELGKDSLTQAICEYGIKIESDGKVGRVKCIDSVVGKTLDSVLFHQLIVPKGGEYRLELPDGSMVWLNSGTKLKFPVRFAGSQRKVYLDGEAFFDVKKDSLRPFRVLFADKSITVLGTRFNLNVYSSDRIWQTTLVEGTIRVHDGCREIMMQPSEQCVMDVLSGESYLKKVDTSLFTAWLDGKFYFSGFTFEEIVAKLERWYDFDMFYQNEKLKQRRFTGVIHKHRPLEEVFGFLEKTTNVRFVVDGKTVTAIELSE